MSDSIPVVESFLTLVTKVASVVNFDQYCTYPFSTTTSSDDFMRHFSYTAEVLKIVHARGREDLVEKNCTRSQKAVDKANSSRLEAIHIRFLSELSRLPILSSVRDLYRCILRAFLTKCAPQKPAPPANWTHRRRGCGARAGRGCQPCTLLDNFLIDPGVSVFNRPLSLQHLNHIVPRLPTNVRNGNLEWRANRARAPYSLSITKMRP